MTSFSKTEPVWKGEYYSESTIRGKLDSFVKAWKGADGKQGGKGKCLGLKNIKGNLERIQKVRETEGITAFLNEFETELEGAVKSCGRCKKSEDISNSLRQEANAFYKKKATLQQALKGFTLASCFAPPNSKELVLAYSNRSACYVEMNQFQDSLVDIERALNVLDTHHKDNADLAIVRKKLEERKGRCEEKVLEKNNNVCNKDQNMGPIYADIFKLDNPNECISSAEDFVTIADQPGRGRHVKVTKDVSPGQVIILEEPYSKVLVQHLRWDVGFCHNCFRDISNTPCLPCPDCVYAVYCNESCRKSDELIHKYDCKVFPYLHKLELKRLVLLSYRTLVKLGPEGFYQFWKSQQVKPSQPNSILGFSSDGKYLSSSYYSINCLIYHDESLTEEELRQYSTDSVLIIDLLDKTTDFFRTISCANPSQIQSLKDFASSLILLHQMNFPCNAHSLNLLRLPSKTPSVEEIRVASTVDFGAGAFALLSMINHSCDPNVTRVTLTNGLNAVVTIRGLKAGDEVLDNYGAHYALEDYKSRQDHLLQNYNFKCDCLPCTHTWPTMEKVQERPDILMCYQCARKAKMENFFQKSFKMCLLDGKGRCNKCGDNYDMNKLIVDLKDRVDNFTSAYELVLENRPSETIKTLTTCLNYFESHVLPPYIYTNFAQETLKHAFNLMALHYCTM